ncbi:MAG: isochorismate synthase [Acidobacteria bacterium]|nr:MAG: isochorismate synthase [Acidobacteriota bacterium]
MSALTSLAPAPAARPSVLDAAEIRAFVAGRLAAHAGRPATLMLSLPAPAVEPETLLRLIPGRYGFLWHPPAGTAFAGCGASHRIDLAGSARFDRLRRAAGGLFARLESVVHPAASPVPPRLFGGLAFAVGAAGDEPWRSFGDGCFTLPRLRYASDGRRATLSLTVRGEDELDRPGRRRWLELLDRAVAGLTAAAGGGIAAGDEPPGDVAAVARAVHPPPLRRWNEQVEAIRAAIADGRCEKIVAAHRSVVELARPVAPATVLRRLENGAQAATRFAFCRPDGTFLGATPERLILRRGRRIATEALAGSIASGNAHAAQLLASAKDRCEHQLVVEQIVRRLEPLCAALEVPPEPRIRALRDVLHLHTPITASLASPRHVLELVELLHPTPAVGGVPTDAALRWIARCEDVGRGWYAGPIGWFDARGDGDFAVALRTCLLRRDRAYLYAGAGIVADSDPALEYEETALKMRSLLAALGAGA